MSRHSTLNNERGVGLIVTILLLMVFLSLGAFALQFSGVDLKIANNHTTGTQALYVAESGLMHALVTMNRIGVVDFNNDVVQRWGTIFTPNPGYIPGAQQLTYQVQVTAGTDTANTGIITSTATGTSGARRVVVALVRRATSFDGRGALYLASDSVNPFFAGSAFEINGYDHDLAGNVVSGGTVKPAVATRTDAATAAVVSELNAQQIPSVQGLGYSTNPLTPSVITSGGPSISDLNQIIGDVLSRSGVVTINDSTISGGTTFGSQSHPQITHLTGSDVTLAGQVSGCGILIADGSVKITGSTDFIGWIIVRGETTINATTTNDTTVLGNASILGALWTGDLNVKVGGSAIIDYSSAALTLADQVDNGGNPAPKPMLMTSWREVY